MRGGEGPSPARIFLVFDGVEKVLLDLKYRRGFPNLADDQPVGGRCCQQNSLSFAP